MTANRFTVKGVTYTAKPFTYGMICKLEKYDVHFDKIEKLPNSLISAYFAICADISLEQAEELIQNHIINGGALDDITDPMAKEMNDSDFFRALSKKEEQTSTTESRGRKKEKSEE